MNPTRWLTPDFLIGTVRMLPGVRTYGQPAVLGKDFCHGHSLTLMRAVPGRVRENGSAFSAHKQQKQLAFFWHRFIANRVITPYNCAGTPSPSGRTITNGLPANHSDLEKRRWNAADELRANQAEILRILESRVLGL